MPVHRTLLATILPQLGFAANTVDFQEQVITHTCKYLANGMSDTHITLPATSTADLNSDFPADGILYRIPFTTRAINCFITDSSGTELQVRFTPSQVTAHHNQKNLTGSALNTELGIFYDPGSGPMEYAVAYP